MDFGLHVIFRGFGITLTSLLGLLMSILFLGVLVKKEMSKFPLNLLLTGQLITDFFLCLCHLTLFGIPAVSSYLGWNIIMVTEPNVIQYTGLAYWAVKIASHYFIVVISVLRYVVVIHPLQARRLITRQRCLMASLSVVFVSSLCAVCRFYYNNFRDESSTLLGRQFWLIGEIIIMYILPLVGILHANICIYQKIKGSQESRSALTSTSEGNETNQLNMMLFAIVATFIFCNSVNILDRFLQICDIYWESFDKFVKRPLMHFSLSVNSLANGFYYCFFGQRFRTELRKLLSCKCAVGAVPEGPVEV